MAYRSGVTTFNEQAIDSGRAVRAGISAIRIIAIAADICWQPGR